MGKKGKGNSAEKAAAKAAKKAKQEKSAQQKALKKEKKTQAQVQQQQASKGKGKGKAKKAPKEEEEDLDALLAKFKEDWELDHAVFEEKQSGAPSRRANATLTPCPNGNDLWLFGGEYFDGEKANFYADLYRYTPHSGPSSSKDMLDDGPSLLKPRLNGGADVQAPAPASETTAKDLGEWRTYSSRNQPGPRSAHQMVASPQSGGLLWMFGGEFASSKMTSFHHYRDFWVFSIANKTWDRIDTKVKPSARSGHRMAVWKNYIVLFGGFIDAGARTTYLNDLWVFNVEEYKWTEVKQNDLRRPSHRSGFSFLPTPEGIVLHGGYCKRYVKGQRTQGVALEDTWFLKMDEDLTKLDWTKRRKVGFIPNPPRSGCTMALWANKQMGVLFGGVTDTEADEESLESTFWNALYGYQLPGTGRWISLNLKKPKKMGGQGGKKKRERAAALAAAKAAEAQRRREEAEARAREEEEEARRGWSDSDDDDRSRSSASDSESESERNKGRQNDAATSSSLATSAPPSSAGAPEDPYDDPDDPQKSVPLERYNTMLAIQRNVLYLYGGIYESGNREYTLDDFYTLDLTKLDRYHCLKECPIDALEWHDSEDEDSSSGSDSGSDSGSESASEDEEDTREEQEGIEYVEGAEDGDDEDILDSAVALDGISLEEKKRIAKEKEELRQQATKFLGISRDTARTEEDVPSTPLPGETIAQFYERSKQYWSAKAFEEKHGENRGKELRRDAFGLASKRYDEYKPLLKEIEAIQAEAGLDAEEMRNAARGSGSALNAGVGLDSRNRR